MCYCEPMAKLEKQDIPFTQVANMVLNDKGLSFKAKGIFSYLFSKPDGWNFAAERIVQDGIDGRSAIFSGLRELEQKQYLERIKLPTGRIEYRLRYSQKPVVENQQQAKQKPVVENRKVRKSQSAKIDNISNKEEESNKEKKETPIAASAAEGPWNFDSYLKKMRDSERRDVAIIGEYWFFKEFQFTSPAQCSVEIRRSLRAAKDLTAYDDERIMKVMDWLYANADYPWKLETVLKFINEDLSKIKYKKNANRNL